MTTLKRRLYIVGGIAILSGAIIVGNLLFFSTAFWVFIAAIVAFCITAPWTYYLRAKVDSPPSLSDDEILQAARIEQKVREAKNGKK